MNTETIKELITEIREEVIKSGEFMLFHLRLNFFANYSVVVQAILSRLELLLSKVVEMMNNE
jgi:hypothetical protein